MGSQRHNLATEQQQRNSSIDKIQFSSVALCDIEVKIQGGALIHNNMEYSAIYWLIVVLRSTSSLTGQKRSQGLNSTLLQVYIEIGEIPAILRARRR